MIFAEMFFEIGNDYKKELAIKVLSIFVGAFIFSLRLNALGEMVGQNRLETTTTRLQYGGSNPNGTEHYFHTYLRVVAL